MEKLDWLEWNPVTAPLSFKVIQHGPFPEKITTIDLSRDDNLNLIAICKGNGDFQLGDHLKLRSGESTSYSEEIIGKTDFGAFIRLKGIAITSVHIESKGLEIKDTDPLLIHAQVSEAKVSQIELPVATQIEWIVNFSAGNYTFCRQTIRKNVAVLKRERPGSVSLERDLTNTSTSSLDHFKCECIIGNQTWSLLVGQLADNIVSKTYNPGFLEFENLNSSCIPSESTKQIILAALSFVLGRQLISVGSTSLDEDGNRIGFEVRKVHILDERSYTQPSRPPVPLGTPQQNCCLNEQQISGVVSAIATKMEALNLEHSLFLIWVGLASPLDVKAAHLGAAIE